MTTPLVETPTVNPQSLTTTSNKDTQKTIQDSVQANALNLTLSALSAALGDIKVLRLAPTGKNSLRYEIIKDEDQIIKALGWISKHGHTHILPQNTADPQLQYFIIQQSVTNMNAWNALVERDLGKVPNESKIDLSATFDLEVLGQRAIEQRRRQLIDNPAQFIPTTAIPTSWITAE